MEWGQGVGAAPAGQRARLLASPARGAHDRSPMASWKANQDKTAEKHRARKHHRVAKNKPPVGSGPETFVIPAGSPPPRLRATRYTADKAEEREIHGRNELASFCAHGGVLWIDVQGLGDRKVLEW